VTNRSIVIIGGIYFDIEAAMSEVKKCNESFETPRYELADIASHSHPLSNMSRVIGYTIVEIE
jgi:hypothetical protein